MTVDDWYIPTYPIIPIYPSLTWLFVSSIVVLSLILRSELTSIFPARFSLTSSAFLDYVVFTVCGRGAVILGSSCSLIYSIKQYQIRKYHRL